MSRANPKSEATEIAAPLEAADIGEAAPVPAGKGSVGRAIVGVLQRLFIPAATSRRRSARSGEAETRKGYGRMAAMILPLVLPIAFVGLWLAADPAESDRQRLRPQFLRPASLPAPSDNVLSGARIELGRRLFKETRLSADGTVSCATCHDPARSFADGMKLSRGVKRAPLALHTPTLWNLAWANALFWDGRVRTLEAQARGPIEHPEEMGSSMEAAIATLKADPAYVAAFAAAFPEQAEVSAGTIVKALASYQRTLVSPMTRFDRWMDGEPNALTSSEKSGFQLFVGKGGCVNCHAGWSFTDHAFHDIGLKTDRKGRGRVIGRPLLDHAFKTPTLRELVWTAPYMHNGSIATLEAVVRHYETGGVDRPSRSPDLPRRLALTSQERADLVAFLRSLSSDRPSHVQPDTIAVAIAAPTTSAGRTLKVGQRDKLFQPRQVNIKAGDTLSIVNDDVQPHNVFITDPRLNYDSGWQEPGTQVSVTFPVAGDFEAFCGIHPNMRLRIEVAPAGQR